MVEKKTYYKLDDIGFIGTQETIPAFRKKADAKKTAEIIYAKKTGKIFSKRRALGNKTMTK